MVTTTKRGGGGGGDGGFRGDWWEFTAGETGFTFYIKTEALSGNFYANSSAHANPQASAALPSNIFPPVRSTKTFSMEPVQKLERSS
jgi:hypothetical protein